MSPNKRRKFEEDAQQTPKSAISALAARRRLGAAAAASSPREASPSPEDEQQPKPRTGNAFSVLQSLRQAERAATSPKSPSTPKTGANSKEGAAKRSTEKGTATPDSGPSTPKVVPFSSFRLTKQNYRHRPNGASELRLSDSERFVVLGSYGIKVRSGEVAILGATLTASDTIYWVHAPHCHALPVIRSSEKTHLELHNDKADKPMMCLSALSPLYQRIWNENEGNSEGASSSGASFKILCTSEDAPKKSIIQELNSPPQWNKAISDIISSTEGDQRAQFSIFVCGPKSAGKSTFSKLLTNRLLTATDRPKSTTGVAVIDLDPGQPEYAPAGTLSLIHVTRPNLGTPFSHPGLHQAGNEVLRCHALASTTPASSPSLYILCAVDLFDTYRRTLRNCPLIINTPGWILGTGLDLLVELITKLMPSQVLYMSEDGPGDVVDILRSTTRKNFTTLPSQPSEYTTRTAAHLRAMQTMSYFHLAETQETTASPAMLNWNPQPISAVPPWQVRYGSKKGGIRGILSYDFQSPPELFAAAINGMVVAVVEIEQRKAFSEVVAGYHSPPQDGQTKVGGEAHSQSVEGAASHEVVETAAYGADDLVIVPSPEGLPMISSTNDAALDPRYSRTLGLALVRGIDVASKTLQLITPIAFSQIQAARSRGNDLILIHGKFDAPTWAYAEDFFFQRATSSQTSGQKDQRDLEVTYEDTSDDESDIAQDHVEDVQDVQAVPWLEVLQGNQKRPVGSRVWRVRRDLGRTTGE